MAKTYARKLSNPKWQRKRLKILERDKWTCKKCGDTETELHVHHLEYHKNPWDTPNKLLITLCAHCHKFIEQCKKGMADKEYDFNKIKIYKSDDWVGGDRIMFARIDEIVKMTIYNEIDEYIIGYNFVDYDFLEIAKLMHKIKT